MAEPHWPLALLAASLAALLLADAALGQTFTYSRGWKPGGKRSRVAAPPLPPRFRALAASAPSPPPPPGPYPDDAAGPLADQTPVRFVVEALAERWAPLSPVVPYEGPPSWPSQPQDHGQDDQHDGERDRDSPPERYRPRELSVQGDHDDH